MARAYSTLHRPGPATPHRLQTLALNEETVPVWALSLVRSFEAGELEDPCHGRAWHWGSKTDALRFFLINPRAQVVDCGPTANVFLR